MQGPGSQTDRSRAPAVPAAEPDTLRARLRSVRAASLGLASPLSAEDQCVQSMPDASPTKWHLAHTTWFFETFVLRRVEPDAKPFDDDFAFLFNSYYHGVGSMHARPARGMLTRPSLETVLEYRASVDAAVDRLLAAGTLDEDLLALVELGCHHEEQHQELMLTDVKHAFSCNPTRPAYLQGPGPGGPSAAPALRWHEFDAGLVEIGARPGSGFCFDNETPRHRVYLEPFALASRPVTAGEWIAFIEDGGYERFELWLSEGWDTVQREGWQTPLYWTRTDRGYEEHTLRGVRPVRAADPVCHLSYFEADAYARWAGARLPREAEWELAATESGADPTAGNFVESGALHPRAATGDASVCQLFGDVWEWTASAYDGYPGFRPAEGAVGEYNGKFMCNQFVLRGGSCATPRAHIRASYRNFFPTAARWQFSGLRLARDA